MITVLYSFVDSNSEDQYRSLFSILPGTMKIRAFNFRDLNSRLTFLAGKLLLMEGWRQLNLSHSLTDIMYNKYQKPYVYGSANFNISHSYNCVVCAISKECVVGVDVEYKLKINFRDFTHLWTINEMKLLNDSNDVSNQFYRIWTRKESIIKADGRGLSIPLNEIDVVDNEVYLNEKKWYLKELHINNTFAAHLASDDHANSDFTLARINF